MQAVVLAAGAGTRLRPVSLTRSKAAVPVCGLTLIERVLNSLAAGGADEFVVVVAELGDDVTQVCGAWGGEAVRFAVQAERLGMGHALLQAAPLLHETFLLSACDSLVEDEAIRRLVAKHRERDALGTLALRRLPSLSAVATTAVVAMTGDRVTAIVEKPTPAEAPSDIGSLPLYVFEPDILAPLRALPLSPRGEYELQDAIQALLPGERGVFGEPIEQRWQVTSVADLLAINRAFLARGQTRADPRCVCHLPVHVAPEAWLGQGVTLGPDVVLEAGCRIGAGARLSRAVVFAGAEVAAGARVHEQVVLPES